MAVEKLAIVKRNRELRFEVDDVRRWELRMSDTGDVELVRYSTDGVTILDTPLSFELDTGAMSSQQGGGIREFANDVVPTIVAGDRALILADSTTGNKAILTDTSGAGAVVVGQQVAIRLVAATGNSYTLALASGTLTFNAAGESATVVRTATGWQVIRLEGATIV